MGALGSGSAGYLPNDWGRRRLGRSSYFGCANAFLILNHISNVLRRNTTSPSWFFGMLLCPRDTQNTATYRSFPYFREAWRVPTVPGLRPGFRCEGGAVAP